ncbi:hypothetical protein F5H01DRAFT_365308 [Linnemannia elongata]|nr:hypothetical protein F5H01DRAFT_365308 [Linnemannia elongata]
MVRATTRLVASTHWSLLNLHHALLSTTTTPATFIRQAAYSTHKRASASVNNNAKNNDHNNYNNLSRAEGTHVLHHTPSRQHKTSERSLQNKHLTQNSPTKLKRADMTKGSTRLPPTPPKVDHSQQKLVAYQLIEEPLPEFQTVTTNQEPSRSGHIAPSPHVHRTRNHITAATERLYKFGYKNAEKHADRVLGANLMIASTSPDAASGPENMTRRSSDNTFGSQEPRRSNSASPVAEHLYPTNFWTVPDTERIESADKEGVQRLFTKRSGTRTVHTDAFSLKSARMTFFEPPAPNVPKFVEQAMEEYNQAMTAYRLNQHQLNTTTEKSTGRDVNKESITPATAAAPLPMPKPSPFIRQYSLRNLRRYPATADAPHPPYRVVYVISKKVVSKQAIHRNLCRKKLSAAVEAVFREHARPGYEFMFFAKQQCVTTSQRDLEEMLTKTLMDPNLYADTASRKKDRYATLATPIDQTPVTTATATSSLPPPPSPSATYDSGVAKKAAIKIRWKNNRPPLKWNWWKYALPNPLGRTRQPDEYLDMHCPKPPKGESTVDSAEHENAASAESKK